MKKVGKIISIVLALVMAITVFVLPASAIDVAITADVTATQVATDDAGNNIYKIGVWVDSTHSLVAVQMNLSWDNSAFQLVRPGTYANASIVNANMVIDKTDDELAMYDGTAYTEASGGYFDGPFAPGYDYAMFPNDGTQPSLSKLSATNLGATLGDAGYTGVYWQWMVDLTDNYLLLSGGKHSGNEQPLSGRIKLLTFYLKEKADAVPGAYTVGFNADQYRLLTGTYTTQDVTASIESAGQGNTASILPSMMTYNNATINVGQEAGPVVEKDRAQVKMTATSATTVADAFTFRVISKITDADWDTYFANTGTDDVSVNAIQKLGFVAYKGTEGFNMDTAKAVAMGTATDANYEAKYTDYVQKVDESSDAYFGARIEFTSAETRTDVTYVGVVEYTDAAGETAYAFYPAEYTAALESNFDAIAAAYLAQYPYAG